VDDPNVLVYRRSSTCTDVVDDMGTALGTGVAEVGTSNQKLLNIPPFQVLRLDIFVIAPPDI